MFEGNLDGGFKDFMAFLHRHFGKFWSFFHMGWNHQLDENEHWGNKDYESIQEPLYKVPSYYYLHLDRGDAILFGGSVRVQFLHISMHQVLIGGLDFSKFHYPLNWKKDSCQRRFRWMSPLWVMFETSPWWPLKMMVKPLPVFVRCFFLSTVVIHRTKETAVSSPQKKDALSSGHFNLLYPMSDFMGLR